MADGGTDPLTMALMLSGNPQAYQNQLAVERQRNMAQALLQGGAEQASSPGEMVSNHYVANPWSHLAGAAREALGAYMLKSADQRQAELYQGMMGQGAPQASSAGGPQLDTQGGTSGPATSAPVGPAATSFNPQQVAAAPQQQGGGFASMLQIPNMTPQQSMMLYMSDRGAWATAYANAYGFTPDMKNALFASGGDANTARQLVMAQAVKAGTQEVRANSTIIPPGGTPFTAPAPGPAGSQVTWPSGQPTMSLVPGAQNAIAGAAYANEAPKAQLDVWKGYNLPQQIAPGKGEQFQTPAGNMPAPPMNFGPQPAATADQLQSHLAGTQPLPAPQNPALSGGVPTQQLATSPQGLKWMESEGPAQIQEAKDAAEGAQDTHYQLQTLRGDLAAMPNKNGTGWFSTGKGAETRVAIAKWVNGTLAASGMQPYFDPNKVASAEGALKTGGRLGFALSRTLGSREAAQIVQQAIGLNPGLANTAAGNDLVARAMDASAQRLADRNEFFTQWMDRYGNTFNADVAFNKSHPIGSYVGLANAPEAARTRLKANPKEAPLFDQTFGAGASQRVLNGPWQ